MSTKAPWSGTVRMTDKRVFKQNLLHLGSKQQLR